MNKRKIVGKHWPVHLGCRTPGECDDVSRCIGCMLSQAHEEGAAIAAGIIALGEWARRNGRAKLCGHRWHEVCVECVRGTP